MTKATAQPLEDVVLQRAQQALDTSPICDLHRLRVERSSDRLLITGTVSSFYHKQLVQELVRSVAQGVQLVNSVDVA